MRRYSGTNQLIFALTLTTSRKLSENFRRLDRRRSSSSLGLRANLHPHCWHVLTGQPTSSQQFLHMRHAPKQTWSSENRGANNRRNEKIDRRQKLFGALKPVLFIG